MIVNYRIAALPPFLVSIYMILSAFEGNWTSWTAVHSLLLFAYLSICVIKRNEYAWLRYDADLDVMLSQSPLFVRRKNIFGLRRIVSVKSLPWIITQSKLQRLESEKS